MNNKMILPPDIKTMIKPFIRISPFNYSTLDKIFIETQKDNQDSLAIQQKLKEHLGRPYILTNSGRHALDLVLDELSLKPDDIVTIYTSLGNWYVSSCVTKTIEQYCKWSMKLETQTKAILVIHEWGIPHPNIEEICSLGYKVIEDCAYSFASSDKNGLIGKYGDYAIYSLTKFFSINFGGIACGLKDEKFIMPEEHSNYIYNCLNLELFNINEIILKRKLNWEYLRNLFSSVNSPPFFQLTDGLVPGVFMFTAHKSLELENIKSRYWEHEIECSVFYGTRGIYVPCNQNLTIGGLEYIFSIYNSILKENNLGKN